MTQELLFQSSSTFRVRFAELIEELHAEAECARWGLSLESFAESLRRSAAKHFGAAQAGLAVVEAYLRSLHLKDLALACACGEGIEPAWEHFVASHRQDLRAAARTVLHGSGAADEMRAKELADSLYAELYGVRSGVDGRRKSLFEYFHGRSKLSTWLRAVLAQRHVDLFRAGSRTVSLDGAEGEQLSRKCGPRTEAPPVGPMREKYLARFERAFTSALRELPPRDRVILAYYYLDKTPLAELGRMFGEHESTVSRGLERIRQTLRERVTRELQKETPARNGQPAEPALDEAQVDLVFEYALEDWPFDLSNARFLNGCVLDKEGDGWTRMKKTPPN